jgi:hypothetical protein
LAHFYCFGSYKSTQKNHFHVSHPFGVLFYGELFAQAYSLCSVEPSLRDWIILHKNLL